MAHPGTLLASGSDPTWDLAAMFGLHNVSSAHSFPYSFPYSFPLKTERYMRAVYCHNSEQVSRTVPTLPFQLVCQCRGPPGSWHEGSDRCGWPTTRRVLAYNWRAGASQTSRSFERNFRYIRESVDSLYSDDTDEISRHPRTKRLKTR